MLIEQIDRWHASRFPDEARQVLLVIGVRKDLIA